LFELAIVKAERSQAQAETDKALLSYFKANAAAIVAQYASTS